jgi:hypothetical protein
MQSLGFVKHACSCYGFVTFRDDEAHKNLHRYLDIGDHYNYLSFMLILRMADDGVYPFLETICRFTFLPAMYAYSSTNGLSLRSRLAITLACGFCLHFWLGYFSS